MRPNRVLFQALSLCSLSWAFALPAPGLDEGPKDKCLPNGVATQIIDGFLSLISAYNNDVADSLLADNFQDTSDSINYLAGIPLGSTTFPTKSAFEQGQGSQGAVPISLINIDAITCDGVIAFRWVAYPATAQLEVKGINVLYTVNSGDKKSMGKGGWQISQVFSEFNNAAWIVDLGLSCNPPTPIPGA